MVDGRDETPFPLDDVRSLYFQVRYDKIFGREAHYESLRAVHDSTRHALLSHPAIERVAVAGRIVGENDFWMRILNSGASISASDLIAGLMARAAELSVDRFRAAARELTRSSRRPEMEGRPVSWAPSTRVATPCCSTD